MIKKYGIRSIDTKSISIISGYIKCKNFCDRIWTLLCQTVYNLKKLLQLYQNEDIEEHSLMKLGLLA